jgi:hypothetical protein
MKKRHLEGTLDYSKNPTFKGKKHSQETIQAMKDLKTNFGLGETNSQFGTCWIYNTSLNENKKINKKDLAMWLELGWIKGRKIKQQ